MTTYLFRIRTWLVVVCMLIGLQGVVFWLTPPLRASYLASDTTFAQQWPYIDRIEYENDDPTGGRALRWAPMQGMIRLPQTTSHNPIIMTMDVHTARPPDQPALDVRIDVSAHATSFVLNPGWRRVALLVTPTQVWSPYPSIQYQLTGPILSERRDLGIAVAQITFQQLDTVRVDAMRWWYVVALWAWLIPMAIRRRWSPMLVLGGGSIVLVCAALWPHIFAFYMPNHWNVVGYIWLVALMMSLATIRRPLVSMGWVLGGLGFIVVLWQLGFGWLGMVLLAALWFFAKPWPDAVWSASQDRTPARVYVALLGIVLVAGVLRIWQLDAFPTGLFRDEARHGGLAWRILAGESMVYSPLANLPAGYFYLSALPIALFDASAWSIRIVAAVVGTASVCGIYWLARPWFGVHIALWSSVVLATLLWHIGLSRIGFPATMGPLLTMIALGAWMRGIQSTRQMLWAVLAGVATGLMLMVYHSARLMPLVVGFTIIWLVWQRSSRWRTFVPAILVFAVVTLVTASPILWYAISQPDNYMRRIDVTSITADAAVRGLPVWIAIFDNLNAYVGMLFVAGDTNPRHFNLGAPQLTFIEGLAFLVGIIWTWHHQRPIVWWLGVWMGIGMISGVLSVNAPHALRTVESIVPIVLLIAIGLYRLCLIVPTRWYNAIVVTVLLGGAIWSAWTYYAWQMNPRTQSRFDTVATDDVRFVQQLTSQLPASTIVFVPESMRNSDLGVFLLHTRQVRVWQATTSLPDQNRQYLVLLPHDATAPTAAHILPWLPDSMHERYSLYCVGQCLALSPAP